MAKVKEEINEFINAADRGDSSDIEEEFGDLLFSCVNVSRFYNLDSEEALTKATDKFIRRFSVVEKLAEENGINMNEASIEELDSLWNKAKEI